MYGYVIELLKEKIEDLKSKKNCYGDTDIEKGMEKLIKECECAINELTGKKDEYDYEGY